MRKNIGKVQKFDKRSLKQLSQVLEIYIKYKNPTYTEQEIFQVIAVLYIVLPLREFDVSPDTIQLNNVMRRKSKEPKRPQGLVIGPRDFPSSSLFGLKPTTTND